MNYRHRLSTRITKAISSLMAIAFALVAFAHGQNCTLLPGRNPSTLMDGQSRTGYQVAEATFTQSCSDAKGIITCISGSVAYGNIFKYPACIPHTWANCTTPTGANHLEYKTLYKLAQATYTQTCQQLSQSLQCLNGVFTGGTTPNLYTYTSCINPNRSQCIDIWTNSYRDHGETVIGYTTNTPAVGQACTTLKKTLTCYNGTWSGGNQNSLYSGCADDWGAQCLNIRTNTYITHGAPIIGYTVTHPTLGQTCTTLQKTLLCNDGTWSGGNQNSLYSGCTNPGAFSGCLNIRTNTTIPHGSNVNTYTYPSGICTGLLHPLTCVNGLWSGGNQTSLYSGCMDVNTQSCPNIITNSGTLFHGSFITKYTQQFAFQISNHYCSDYAKSLQCTNGIRSGNVSGLFTGCQDVGSGSCLDVWSNNYIPNTQFIYGYTSNQPTNQSGCAAVRKKLFCNNGQRKNSLTITGSIINQSSHYPTCGNCILPRGTILPEGQSTYVYSAILRSVTGQNYIGGCAPFSGQVRCTNSMLQGTGIGGAFTPSNFPYSLQQCQAGQPKNCTEWQGGIINHTQSPIGYSVTGAIFPKTCIQNYSTQLSCINGDIDGNYQTYKYSGCADIGSLVNGIDLAINESPGLPGQENISGGIIAQGSSPQINMLFQNKGTDIVNQAITAPGFLTCKRTQQNLEVYSSNPITSFVVNPGTKVGINIRIKTLFTQALGTKKLLCKIDTSMIAGNIVGPGNDTRSGTFEIVQADRFDLALSRSIESISKNLEAAEGAKGVQGVQNFLYNKIMNVVVPLVIILGILSAILGFYKIMFSSEDTATKEGTRYIIYGVIGIVLIMSAKFIGQNVFDLLNPASGEIKGYEMAAGLYDKIIYPFIKFAIYLVLGAMFVILVSRVITFLFGSDTDAQKKAGTLIGWNVISMLIIIGAKQIVEAIYGKQTAVVKDITNLGEVGSGVLADKNIPILYQVINYALGIASLVILIVIIIQTVKLLTKPDDPAQVKSIKNSLLYMVIGIFVLGAGYLIVNFAIIN